MEQKRNSNIELLRIIAIIFIVLSHYTVHSGIDKSSMPFGFNRFILEVSTLGNLGTLMFIMISGYFLIYSNHLKIDRLIKTIFQIFFYSSTIYIILVALNIIPFSNNSLLKSIFPIISKEYWFATAYIILYLFYPFINKLINNLTRREHLKFILLLALIFFFLPTITTNSYYASELIQFLTAYAIGAYIRKYPDNYLCTSKYNLLFFILTSTIIVLSVLISELLGANNNFLNHNAIYLLDRTSIITLMHSTFIFIAFTKIKIESNFINIISSSTFSVYLISDNNYIRSILWHDIFNNFAYQESVYLILHMLISTITTIAVCIIIDQIKKYLIDRPLFTSLENLFVMKKET